MENKDATLVLKALGGRLETDEDKVAAKELADKLTEARFKEAMSFASEMEKNVKVMKKLKGA